MVGGGIGDEIDKVAEEDDLGTGALERLKRQDLR